MAWADEGQLADLVEKDRAAGGSVEPAGLLAVGAGERAALVAEQLALDQALGKAPQLTRMNGPAPRSEWRCSAVADQLLAGTAFADDQDRRVGRGREADRLEDLTHRGTLADQLGLGVSMRRRIGSSRVIPA